MFGGSGSTLIACEMTGRSCVTCEIDEHYCDVIKNRYRQYMDKHNGDKIVEKEEA